MSRVARDALAALLNGREYDSEMTEVEEVTAKAAGLLVIFGGSDDQVRLYGAVRDQVDAHGDTKFMLHPGGAFLNWESLERKYEELTRQYFINKAIARQIEALWCAEPGYSWTYRTDVPHATFEIVEDGEPYCRGIVIDVADLAAP